MHYYRNEIVVAVFGQGPSGIAAGVLISLAPMDPVRPIRYIVRTEPGGTNMSESRTVLLVGIEPDQVDFSDPDLPPGMNADRIRAGLVIAEQQFIDHGDQVDLCALGLDGIADAVLVTQLIRADYDCLVIGGGLRRPAAHY